jgi:hypothetical protein
MPLSQQVRAERVAHYRAQIESIVRGRRWIVGQGVLVGATRMGKQLLDLGAEAVLAIAGSEGTGDIFEHPQLSTLNLNISSTGMMAGARDVDAALQDLPPHARATVEAFDPRHEAHAVGSVELTGQAIAGRPVLGARRPAWLALEDKTVVDALWQRAGIVHAPSALVSVTCEALSSAGAELDQGMGTIWVGDNKEGWHGGAKMLRWVRSEEDARAAHTFLAAHCDRARVMPFIDGIPCSIHAFVSSSAVCPVRPCEMLVYRRLGSTKLTYGGVATNWVPSPAQSSQMVESVRRVGEQIRTEVDYRGSFSLDGICNQDGFFPTEINPRIGGGMGRMAFSMPDLPLILLHNAMASGVDLDYRPEELADLIASEAHAKPVLRAMSLFEGTHDLRPEEAQIVRSDGRWSLTEDEDAAQGTISIGPASFGSILFADMKPSVIPHGQSAAPLLAAVMMMAAKHWGLEFSPLIPAPDLR